jgi:hypothetical protein
MQVATVGNVNITIGWVIALIVLIVDIILMAIGQMDIRTGALIGGVALARLC